MPYFVLNYLINHNFNGDYKIFASIQPLRRLRKENKNVRDDYTEKV